VLRHEDIWGNGGIGASVIKFRSLLSDSTVVPQAYFGWSVKLTTYHHLALWLRMYGELPPLPVCSLMACYLNTHSYLCCSPLELLSLVTAMFDIDTVTDMTGEE